MARLLVQQKGLWGHVYLGEGHHLLGKSQDFGLWDGQQWLRSKHGSLRKRLGDLVHQGLEQRQRQRLRLGLRLRLRKVRIFKISEALDLAVQKRHYWRFKEGHHFAPRKDVLLNFGDFHYFRLRERQHHNRLSKRQDILWRDGIRDGISIRID